MNPPVHLHDDVTVRTHVDASVYLPDEVRAFLLEYQRRPLQIRHLVRMYECCLGNGYIDGTE